MLCAFWIQLPPFCCELNTKSKQTHAFAHEVWLEYSTGGSRVWSLQISRAPSNSPPCTTRLRNLPLYPSPAPRIPATTVPPAESRTATALRAPPRTGSRSMPTSTSTRVWTRPLEITPQNPTPTTARTRHPPTTSMQGLTAESKPSRVHKVRARRPFIVIIIMIKVDYYCIICSSCCIVLKMCKIIFMHLLSTYFFLIVFFFLQQKNMQSEYKATHKELINEHYEKIGASDNLYPPTPPPQKRYLNLKDAFDLQSLYSTCLFMLWSLWQRKR